MLCTARPPPCQPLPASALLYSALSSAQCSCNQPGACVICRLLNPCAVLVPHMLQDTWESTQDAAKGTAKDVKKAAEGLGDRISGH